MGGRTWKYWPASGPVFVFSARRNVRSQLQITISSFSPRNTSRIPDGIAIECPNHCRISKIDLVQGVNSRYLVYKRPWYPANIWLISLISDSWIRWKHDCFQPYFKFLTLATVHYWYLAVRRRFIQLLLLLSRQGKSWNEAKIRFRDFDGFTRCEGHWVQKSGFYKMSVCRLSSARANKNDSYGPI